jgi:hypothetical protein
LKRSRIQLRSRHHTKIGAQILRPFDIGAVRHSGDEPGAVGPQAECREDAPTVEGREAEVADHGVERLTCEEIESGLSVGRDFPLHLGPVVGPVVHHEHARDHRAPPP